MSEHHDSQSRTMIHALRYVAATCLTGATILGIGSLVGSETNVLAAAPASAGSQADLEIEEVDIANFPTVHVTVAVPGGLESILANGGSFSVTENGKPRPTTATNILSRKNLEVILVIDRSGSMAGDAMAATKTAAIGFLTAMPPEIPIGLVTFGSDVTLDVESTRDRDRLTAAISAITAKGRTALNNAIVYASTLFAPTTERRVLVLLSDGGDTASSATLAAAVAATSGIRVEIIELVTPETNPNALKQLAGPRLVRAAPGPAKLAEMYISIAQSLVGLAEIVYTSEAQAGGTLDLDIRLVGANQVWDASVAFNAPSLSTPLTISAADSASSPTNSSEPANQGFSWILLVAIMIIFGGLVLLMTEIFVSADRSLWQRLYPTNAPIVNRSAAESIAKAIEHRLRNSTRYEKLVADVGKSGVDHTTSALILNTVVIAALAMVAGYLFIGILGVLIAVFAVPYGSLKLLQRKIKRRRIDFVAQLPDTLQMLGSMLRSGYGLVQALDTVATESEEPTHNLLGQVMLEVRAGRDLIESLRATAAQLDSIDFDWFVVCIEISRDVGSDLATTLDTVAETVRERENLRGRISALTAEGRLSAYVMLVLPPIVGVMSFVVNKDFAGVLFEGVGLVLLAATGFLMFIGFIWMQSIIAKVS